jgi:hypothetical protein
MRPIIRRLTFIFALALAMITSGCATYVIKTPKGAFAGYAPADKIDLTVALNVTDDLRNAQWERRNMAIRPGSYLAENCATVARHVFREVAVGTPNQATLTPKVVYLNRTQGATSFGESITTVKLEWSLSDPSGKPVWIETVTGEARGSTGWTAPEKLLQKALEQVLANSQQAMVSSAAIRQFAARKVSRAASP